MTQRSGHVRERTSKETQRGMPTPGRPEWSGLCEDDVGADIIRPPSLPLGEGGIAVIRGPHKSPAERVLWGEDDSPCQGEMAEGQRG